MEVLLPISKVALSPLMATARASTENPVHLEPHHDRRGGGVEPPSSSWMKPVLAHHLELVAVSVTEPCEQLILSPALPLHRHSQEAISGDQVQSNLLDD